ncbi:MAG: aldehyde ferredoxin oxidoreductase family protein, partial [Chloroflexi bacterium]|nr:aldehyde ferredoxin oxidoreductase family protein [Chloroflexota bacterium]
MSLTAVVNLSDGSIHYSETDSDLRRRFLGGRGLGAKLLFNRVGPEVGPFDPGNCLIFTTGPFSGTPWPTASRYHVTFKSPATGAYGYANSGGHFAPELARAGFDALIVTGRAPAPVYLLVADRAVTIRPADHLWGQGTYAAQDALLGPEGRTGKNGRVLCIGPAGEKRARIAAIVNDYGRAAARGGPGAVMGSKNLKAIHVRPVRYSRPDRSGEFAAASRRTGKHLIADPKNRSLMTDGTLFLMRPKNLTGDLPAKNHQLAQVPFIDEIDPLAIARYKVKRMGCAACPIRCSRLSVVTDGRYAAEVEGPEYETTDAFGPMCWNADPAVIIRANFLCNEYGLDTISTGVTIAFAMECHERGLLSDPDLSLGWGDGPSIVGLVEKIGRREGIGDALAEGVRRAAAIIGGGSEDYAMHVKGLEMPRQEPRFSKGFGLGHATSNRGADHLYGLPAIDLGGNWATARKIFPAEIVEPLMDTEDETYKPDMLIYGEHYCAVTDALGICKFSTAEEYSLLPDDLAPGLRALGIETDGAALLEIGEPIVNLERLCNVREGKAARRLRHLC